MKALSIVAANHHRKRVFKPERFDNLEVKSLGVERSDARVDSERVTGGRLVQDGSERGSRVFDIQVQLSGKQSLVNQQCAAQVCFPFNGNPGARLNVLRQKFRQNHLFREELGTDNDLAFGRLVAGGEYTSDAEHHPQAIEPLHGMAHVTLPSADVQLVPAKNQQEWQEERQELLPPEATRHSPWRLLER